MAETSGKEKLTIWYVLKKKERILKLSNTKTPGTSHTKNTLQEVRISLSTKSTIKRHLYECTYIGFTRMCKPLVTLENRETRLDFPRKTSKKSQNSFGTRFFGQMKPG